MIWSLLADGVVLLHLAFLVFVVVGGVAVLRWPRVALAHVPAAVWGAWIEFTGGVCPLTPLENRLRRMAGGAGYPGGFIDHYLVPLIYPSGLTRTHQLILGAAVLVVNGVVYALVIRRWRRRRRGDGA